MRFKVKAADLAQALAIVDIVPPLSVTGQGGAGYLFHTYVREGAPFCRITSKDRQVAARAEIPLLSLEGEGVFIAPIKVCAGLNYIPDYEIEFDVRSENDVFYVKTTTTNPQSDKQRPAVDEVTSFDPRTIAPIDSDCDSAAKRQKFPAGLLREAIAMSAGFIALDTDNRAEEHFKTLQIFDDSNEAWAKGKGTMFATNGTQIYYFYSEVFEQHGLAVHSKHMGRLTNFLAKCVGDVEFRHGDRMMFAVATLQEGNAVGEQVFGWAHQVKTHSKYNPYPAKLDKFVLRVPKMPFANAISYVQKRKEKDSDKVRINFSAAERLIYFTIVEGGKKAESFPIPVIDAQMEEERDFSYSINIDHLHGLINAVKGNEVIFHVAPLPKDERRPKEAAMFRTVDEFWMSGEGKVIGGSGAAKDEQGNEKRPVGGYKCRVTRFMPSKV